MGKQKHIIQRATLLAAGVALLTTPAYAAKSQISKNCTGCHQAAKATLWGTIVPGSQTDTTVEVSTGKDVWKVRYDKDTDLEAFKSAKELRDEKAVMVEFRPEAGGGVYAEEMSYKPNYPFHTMENVITMSDVAQIMKKSPEEGNYMIVDARGYDNFIEGHMEDAVNIPYYRLMEFKDRLPQDKNTMIIGYCRGFT